MIHIHGLTDKSNTGNKKSREASDAADIEAYNHAERELANYQAMRKIKY